MTAPAATAAKLIEIVKGEIGVHEGRNSSGWNNDQKYSDETPGFDWSDFQPWCDTFCAWGFWKAGLTEDEAPRSASCDASGAAWKKMGRWSEYPAIGAQVFFGTSSDLQHTGIVTKYDDTYIWTVEGNTNASGSYQGDGVYAKMHARRDARVIGYGYPKFSHPIVSADPKWQPKPEPVEHGPEFAVAQVSGHFDATEFEWQAALARAAEASVRIVTETTRPGIPRKVKEPGVSMTRLNDEPGQDEISILWDRDTWEKASEPYAVRLTETTWHTGTGHKLPPRWATVQPLRHKASGRVAMFAGFHAPNDDSLKQRAAHAELMDALDRVWDIGRERHPDAVRVVGFDLNLDMRLQRVRDLWVNHAPRLQLCWNEDTLPARGTIGKVRVIDGVAHGMGLELDGKPKVLDLMPGMDHRCVIVPLRWAQS